jgi:hypothetical protein
MAVRYGPIVTDAGTAAGDCRAGSAGLPARRSKIAALSPLPVAPVSGPTADRRHRRLCAARRARGHIANSPPKPLYLRGPDAKPQARLCPAEGGVG